MPTDFLYLLPLVIYVGVVVAVTLLARSGSEDSEYFFAGKRLNFVQAFISVLSSETSVAATVVFPAAGMKNGYALLWLVAGYIIGRSVVAVFYLPKLYESSRLTIYRTMSRHHGVLEGAYLLAKYISGGVRFFIGAYALHQVLGGPTVLWLFVVAVCVAGYSLTGGLKAVVMMDQVQGALIVGVGIFLCVYLGGHLPADAAWNPAFADFDFSHSTFSPALLLGGAVLSIGTHGADQDLILRVLATKSLREARKSLIFSGLGAAILIGIYLTVGYLLFLTGTPGLDAKSPLADYVTKSGLQLLRGVFLVLLFAAAMSSLDSAIHSTGAVWKSLVNSNLPGRYWSSLSLLIMTLSGILFFSISQRHASYLDLAMGSMNYINTGLIGIFTVFTFFPRRLTALGIPFALAAGFCVTAVCEWGFEKPIPFSYTVVLGSAAAIAFCLGAGQISSQLTQSLTIDQEEVEEP